MLFIELVIMIFLGILLSCKIKNNWLRNFILILLEALFIIDIISILSQNTHINYSFLANIDLTSIKITKDLFLWETIIGSLAFLITISLTIAFSRKLYDKLNHKKNKGFVFSLALLVIFFSGGIFLTARKSFTGTDIGGELESRDKILKTLDINPKEYLHIDEIQSFSGKNIVLIYLESLEQNFMKPEIFDNLTPNLTKLSKEWSYFNNYIQIPGTGWTLGALYATMTGLPAFFGLRGNKIFANTEKSEVISIGQILQKAGYNQLYLNGASLDYSGKRYFLSLQGYEAMGNEELDPHYPRHEWGVRDKDIFEEAKMQYLKLSQEGKPFNLTLLTVDLHFPDGFPDKRLTHIVGGEPLGTEYVVKSTDYLLGDFIDFIQKQENSKDTVIFILPDHTLMGNSFVTSAVKKLNMQERKLFLLTNASNIKDYSDPETIITYYDVPKIILNGAGISTNAKFLIDLKPDLLSLTDNKEFLDALTKLNLALLIQKKEKGNE